MLLVQMRLAIMLPAPRAILEAASLMTVTNKLRDPKRASPSCLETHSSSVAAADIQNTVAGANTAGTVRVNNLAHLEGLLNALANGMEILGIAWGGPTMLMGFMQFGAGSQAALRRVLWGAASCSAGLATPGCLNWLVATARDANLFS